MKRIVDGEALQDSLGRTKASTAAVIYETEQFEFRTPSGVEAES